LHGDRDRDNQPLLVFRGAKNERAFQGFVDFCGEAIASHRVHSLRADAATLAVA